MSHTAIKRGIIAVIFLAITGLFGIGVINSSQEFQKCVSTHLQSKNGKKIVQESPSYFLPPINCASVFVDKNSDSITAVATFLLVWVTMGLIFMGFRQEDTIRTQLRAYVFIRASGINISSAHRTVKAAAAFRNYGATPAKSISLDCAIYLEDELISNKIALTGVLPPADEMLYNCGSNRVFTLAEYNNVLNGNLKIFLKGNIVYTDAFNQVRKTHFKKYIQYTGIPHLPDIEHPLGVTEDGNDWE